MSDFGWLVIFLLWIFTLPIVGYCFEIFFYVKKRNTILKENYMDWDKAIQDVKEYQKLANQGEVPFLSSKEDTFTNIILMLQLGKKYEQMWEDPKSSLDYIDDSEFLDSMEKSEECYLKGVNNKNGKR